MSIWAFQRLTRKVWPFSAGPRIPFAHRHLAFESLEERRVLTTLLVTTLTDAAVTGPGSAPGTLRQAIYDANLASDADVIEFAPGLSGEVNLAIADDVSFGPTAIVVSTPITIRGNSNGITINRDVAAGEMRLFRVTSGASLTLDTISVTGGIARGPNATMSGENGGLGLGGAVLNQGSLHILASTIYANTATGGDPGSGGQSGPARGGAIYSDAGTVTVTSSTFSGNVVSSGGVGGAAGTFGGAIYTFNGNVTIHNSTLTNSTAFTGRGLYVFAQNGTATIDIHSSILGQSDTHFSKRDFLTAPDENGQIIVTGSNNLIRVQGDFDYITTLRDDPMLGPLADHGGPTLTHAPAAESPVIDAGNNLQSLTVDQRGDGFARVIGSNADMGAFEVQTAAGPALPGDYNRDDIVDAADFILWRMTRGTSVLKFSGADGDGDGEVTNADYAVWRSYFGQSLQIGARGPSSPAAGASETAHSANSDSSIDAGRLDGHPDAYSAAFGLEQPWKIALRRFTPNEAQSVAGTRRGEQAILAWLYADALPLQHDATTQHFVPPSKSSEELVVDSVFGEWSSVIKPA